MPQPIRLSGPGQEYSQEWLQRVQSAVNSLGIVRATDVQVVVNGFSYQIGPGTGTLLLTPAAGLASGTVTLPAQALDGFQQHIVSSQSVGTLTVSPSSGQTIVGGASVALAAGSEIVYRFVAAGLTWYRVR